VLVVVDDLLDDRERLGVERAVAAEPAAGPGQVDQQVVDVLVLVGPQSVHRAAGHPRPLDDLLEPQVLDRHRRAGLDGQLAARVEHALPDFFRRYPFRAVRHLGLSVPRQKEHQITGKPSN
jgi:hypothetical protein